jgi:CDP-diacylglycerol--glycerol-3-phosphate 3-phosphatidyltransferase
LIRRPPYNLIVLLQDLQIAPAARRWPLTWPMALTALRFILLPIFLWLIWPQDISNDHRRWAAAAIFLLMCVTDILDGYLARRLHQTSRLGTLLDPTADKLLVETSLLLLCVGSKSLADFTIPWPVVLGAYLKDLGVLIGIAVVIRRNGSVKLAAQRLGKICTAFQLSLVITTLLAADIARWNPTVAAVLLWFLWWATVWATAASGWAYSYQGSLQLRAHAAPVV